MTTSIQPQQPEDTLISKSQKKREMDALQDLGKTLAGLSTDTLKTMPIPDELREAIREYKRLNAHGALRRQLQYICKLMRSVDAEPIEARLAVLRGESDQHTGWLHRLERWRDRLLAEDKALDALLAEYPGLDVQTLRTHIRNARREQAERERLALRQIVETRAVAGLEADRDALLRQLRDITDRLHMADAAGRG